MRGGHSARPRPVSAAIALALVVGACASTPPVTPSSPPSGSGPAAIPSASGPARSISLAASPSPASASASSASPAAPSAAGAGPVRDDSLLAILPADIDGVPVVPEEAAFADATRDPAFARNVAAAAFATAVSGQDLASGVVARPVSGVFGDAFFRDWRETYDEGACAQAGGVVGNAEADIGGRPVHITTCAGGLRVYHTYVAERDVIVSLISLGEARFGERLMAGIRP